MTSPVEEVTLPDPAPAPGELRRAPWHLAALMCCGHTVAPHEFKHDPANLIWRTWHISPHPVIPVGVSHGAAAIMEALDTGDMRRRQPAHPYLAAYLAAKNYDIILAYRAGLIAEPIHVAIDGNHTPLAELVSPTAAIQPHTNLADLMLGHSYVAKVRDIAAAAALATIGFPFMGLMPDGAVRLAGLKMTAEDRDPDLAEALLCPDLSFRTTLAACSAVRAQAAVASRQNVIGHIPPLESPLPTAHLFHWCVMGTLRRDTIRGMEGAMGHDSSPHRSHVIHSRPGQGGDAVIATADEYNRHEDRIISHIRKHS